MPSLMSIVSYIVLLVIFFINFTKEYSASHLTKSDWVVLFASPAALVFSFNHYF